MGCGRPSVGCAAGRGETPYSGALRKHHQHATACSAAAWCEGQRDVQSSNGRWDDEGNDIRASEWEERGVEQQKNGSHEADFPKNSRLAGQIGVIGQRLPAQLQGCPYSLMEDAYPVKHNHLHAAAIHLLTCQHIALPDP